jgi:hypothetical protein
MLILGACGVFFGIKLTHQTFSVTVSLIKRRVPQTVQASEVGQAYRPVDLNDATLLATLLASEPLDKAIKRAQNGIDPNRARSLVEATQLEGTDIFYITYHSPISPEDAINFSVIWAEEIETYTQQLQRTEAHGVRLILQKEVTELENQTSSTNAQILTFSKDKDYFGGESQVSAALSKLSLIELQLETARATASSKTGQLKSLTEQIQRQSPIELQLKTANEELANLRATYTDANPLVQTKLQSIEYLSSQVEKLNAQKMGDSNFDAYTGTPLGNQIFLNILALQDQIFEANSQIESLEKLKASTISRISEFPAIISDYEALKTKRSAISEGLSIMTNRLKEAEIFASGAPGYWQVFQAPDKRSISPSSLVSKPAILGIGGAALGGGITALLTLLLTHRSDRRSALECCVATSAPLVSLIYSSSEAEKKQAMDHFWITYLAPRLRSTEKILFWTAALESDDEREFWKALSTAISADRGGPLQVHDLTPDGLWKDDSENTILEWRSDLLEGGIIRAAALPALPMRGILAETRFWLAVVSGDKKSATLASKSRSLTSAYLPACAGTLVWIEKPAEQIRKVADVLSCFLAKRFS